MNREVTLPICDFLSDLKPPMFGLDREVTSSIRYVLVENKSNNLPRESSSGLYIGNMFV